jgi:4-hydroxy-4-methyl-2-oxoglutarate aldolase
LLADYIPPVRCDQILIHLNMPNPMPILTRSEFESLGALETCSASNAIEQLEVRLRNEGFVQGTALCRFPQLSPMLGYAATAVIRSSAPPMAGRCYYNRMDWWNYLLTVPEPRVMVLQDLDHTPGIGAFIGEIHANIALALHCIGCVTNGAVRDLVQAEKLGFHLFAGSVAVSHAYAHIVEFGDAVEIGGLKISSGDLVHGDRHGVQTIPLSIASKVPDKAAEIEREERELMQFCKSSSFSIESLALRLERAASMQDEQAKRARSI